jgi:hypothetical protein
MSIQRFCININMSLFVFPAYLYFDQEVTFSHNIPRESGDITFNWSAKVKVREYGSTLTLMSVQSDKPYILKPAIGPKTIPVCKSNLQKCVRRQDTDRAIRTALAMFNQNPNEVLRRLPVIMIEDCLLYPKGLSKLIFWMCAVSKGYKMSSDEVSDMLGIVATMCESKVYDTAGHKLDRDELDYNKISKQERDFLYSLEVRKFYGGMKCDSTMINYHISMWYNRFINKDNVKLYSIYDQTEYTIELDSVDDLEVDDLLLESFDYHCYPFILKKMCEKFDEIPENMIKLAIWDERSRVNFRTPINNDLYRKTNHRVSCIFLRIKKELTCLTSWLRKNIELSD